MPDAMLLLKRGRMTALRLSHQHPLAAASLIYLLLLLVLAIVVPGSSPYAADQGSDSQFSPPNWHHWFGTDVHGRDLFTRVFAGTRISLLVGVVGTSVSLVIGVGWGMMAGYHGGRLDAVLMRVVDILYSLPGIVLVIVLITTTESAVKQWSEVPLVNWVSDIHWLPTRVVSTLTHLVGILPIKTLIPHFWVPHIRLFFLFVGLGSVSWLTMARIIRGQVLSLRTRPFVVASQALGAGNLRILWYHILPNVTGLAVVYLTLTIPAIILYESFLSYLGLGIQPPNASLGTLIAEGAGQINPLQINWWLVLCPGTVLSSTLLALSFVGDGLKTALDPRSKG